MNLQRANVHSEFQESSILEQRATLYFCRKTHTSPSHLSISHGTLFARLPVYMRIIIIMLICCGSILCFSVCAHNSVVFYDDINTTMMSNQCMVQQKYTRWVSVYNLHLYMKSTVSMGGRFVAYLHISHANASTSITLLFSEKIYHILQRERVCWFVYFRDFHITDHR